MANESVISGLFGLNPYQVQQQQFNALRGNAANFAQLNPEQRAAQMLYQGGGMLGGAAAEAIGFRNPDVELARQQQQIMNAGDVDMSTPDGLKAKAAQFASAGDQATAMKLIMLAQKREMDIAEIQEKQARAKYYEMPREWVNPLSQLPAKQAIARNDAIKIGFNAGLRGQELLDFAEQQVQRLTDTWNQTISGGVPQPQSGGQNIALSPMTAISENLKVTKEQKDAMINDAMSRGDTEAAMKMKDIPVISSPVLPKSKAEVAGEVKLAQTIAANNPAALSRGEAAKKAGDKAAETNELFYNQAESANAMIPKLDRVINEIESSTFKPGIFADFRTSINKARAMLGGVEGAKKASEAEVLNALMGQDVFSLMGAMGLGSKQMDTPAEREFMRQVLAGTISMERGALKRLAELRKEDAQRTIDRYNQKVDSGELDNFFSDTSRSKKKFGAQMNARKWNSKSGKWE